MSYTIKPTFSIRVSDVDTRKRLQLIAEMHECDSAADLFFVLLDGYEGNVEVPDQPEKASSKKPDASESLFVAQIDPLDQADINQMRKSLYQKHRFKDTQILAHFSQLNRLIEEEKAFVIRPWAKLRDLIVAKGQPEIDEGNVKDLGQFIAKKLDVALKVKPKEKKEDGGFWGL